MTKSDFRHICKQLDEAKGKLYSKGIIFNLVAIDEKTNEHHHVGIGTMADMTELNLKSLASQYISRATGPDAIDEYARSVEENLRRYLKEQYGIKDERLYN